MKLQKLFCNNYNCHVISHKSTIFTPNCTLVIVHEDHIKSYLRTSKKTVNLKPLFQSSKKKEKKKEGRKKRKKQMKRN